MKRSFFQRSDVLLSVTLVAALGMAISTIDIATAQDGPTTTHRVIEPGGLGQDHVLDANDHPVLAYQYVSPGGQRSLKVARCTDVSCDGVLVERLVNLGPGLPFGTGTTGSITLMIDSNDRPVVGYTQDNEVRVARCFDRLCRRVNLQTLGLGQLAAFALDQNDRIVAVYATEAFEGDSSAWVLELARCSNKRCRSVTTSRIETAEQSSPQRAALAVDSNNKPVLSYIIGNRLDFENPPPSAVIARCIDSACDVVNKTTIIEAGFLDPPVMVLDRSDNPVVTVVDYQGLFDDLTHYVACLDVDCNARHQRRLVTNWERNLSVKPRSLAIAADDSVTFVVVGESDGILWPELWRCESLSCDAFENRGLISGTPALGGRPTLAVDQAGYPVVAYAGEVNPITGFANQELFQDLTVARCGSAKCENVAEVQGMFYFQNVRTSKYLALRAEGTVGTSTQPGSNEIWEVEVTGFGNGTVRNVQFDQYLDLLNDSVRIDANPQTQWLPIRPDTNGIASLRESSLALTGRATGSGVEAVDARFLDTRERRNQWRIIPLDPVAPNELVGTRIALQNAVTGRWLDNDQNGSVDQSAKQSADDIWLIQDAGDGYVLLVNDFTGLYLDADNGKLNLDSSSSGLGLDRRWELRFAGDKLTIRNVRFEGYVTAQGRRNRFNSIRQPDLSGSSYWTPFVID